MAETLFFNALREAIDEEMERDSTVMVMGEDVGHYGGSYKVTKDLCKKVWRSGGCWIRRSRRTALLAWRSEPR